MRDLWDDSGSIFVMIRLVLFIYLYCNILFVSPVLKSLHISGDFRNVSQSELSTCGKISFSNDFPSKESSPGHQILSECDINQGTSHLFYRNHFAILSRNGCILNLFPEFEKSAAIYT